MQQSHDSGNNKERLAAAVELLSKQWGLMHNFALSGERIFGSFTNLNGPGEALFEGLDVKMYVQTAVPQRRGGPADMVIAVGVILPVEVHFTAKARPAYGEGMYNLDIELLSARAGAVSEPTLREVLAGACEDILGKELADPEFLAYFVRRQLDLYSEKRLVLVAEIARLVAEEIAHASRPKN
jgi:hypothetical protein